MVLVALKSGLMQTKKLNRGGSCLKMNWLQLAAIRVKNSLCSAPVWS